VMGAILEALHTYGVARRHRALILGLKKGRRQQKEKDEEHTVGREEMHYVMSRFSPGDRPAHR